MDQRGSLRAFTRSQWRGHLEHLPERDSCGEHGCGPGEVEGDVGDAGERDQESEAGKGGAFGEGEAGEEGDWV